MLPPSSSSPSSSPSSSSSSSSSIIIINHNLGFRSENFGKALATCYKFGVNAAHVKHMTLPFTPKVHLLTFNELERNSVIIDSFLFITVSHGIDGWTQRADFLDPIRSVLDEYPQYNITLFDYDGTIFDLISSVKVLLNLLLKQL
ncbi:hypothetical protein LOAG_03838 [Loa loa]|uniref:Uncharacterized protein n=1 Tax=Loa loa TaxID=7209 RepID=A0A1S0U5H1_LOALO|nr:hypothetical protein LOAG_03838 [Loa loa]EFO24651.1 hypothetical protein LOAG_03838 [Loa loa]